MLIYFMARATDALINFKAWNKFKVWWYLWYLHQDMIISMGFVQLASSIHDVAIGNELAMTSYLLSAKKMTAAILSRDHEYTSKF